MMNSSMTKITCTLLATILAMAGAAVAQSPEADGKLSEYKSYLISLKPSDTAAILEARDRFNQSFPPDDPNAAQGFREFRRFYESAIEANNQELFHNARLATLLMESDALTEGTIANPLLGYEKIDSEGQRRIKAEYPAEFERVIGYIKSGLRLVPDGEGGWYLAENHEFLDNILAGYDLDLIHYIRFMKENPGPILADGGMIITWDALRERIIRFEDFASRYPDLPETKSKIRPELRWQINLYLSGVDNSPVFEFGTGNLDPELKASYERFLEENKGSGYYKLVAEAYEIHKKNGFKKSAEARKFMDRLEW